MKVNEEIESRSWVVLSSRLANLSRFKRFDVSKLMGTVDMPAPSLSLETQQPVKPWVEPRNINPPRKVRRERPGQSRPAPLSCSRALNTL